jgi:hypothetical protein
VDIFEAVMAIVFVCCAVWYRRIAQRFRRAGADVHWSWTAGTLAVAALSVSYGIIAATTTL